MDKSPKPQMKWFAKIRRALLREPQDKEQLSQVLEDAKHNKLLDDEAHTMIKGALQVSEMTAREVMVPKIQMVCIDDDATLHDTLSIITQSGHSRFPVVNEQGDKILGILLAKDLLKIINNKNIDLFNINKLVRKASVIHEDKKLNVLLKEFRSKRNHMALVIDEYGIIVGLITIEDVLEQIVGEIEDEYDTFLEDHIRKITEKEYIISALTPIEQFNQHFNCHYQHDDFETMSGFLLRKFTYIPKKGESIKFDNFTITITNAANRKINQFRLRINDEAKKA